MIPAALDQAARDRRLRGAPLAVYVWCLSNLDVNEFRTVKVLRVSNALGLKDWITGRALRILVTTGYLQGTTRRRQNEPRRFRLRWTVEPVSRAS